MNTHIADSCVSQGLCANNQNKNYVCLRNTEKQKSEAKFTVLVFELVFN